MSSAFVSNQLTLLELEKKRVNSGADEGEGGGEIKELSQSKKEV